MAFSNPVTGGQGGLIRPAIKSPNFLTGVSGWTVNRDGSVEFNNGVFRGTLTASTFMGTDFIISAAGQFFYSGTPALGNLLYSVCVADGTDSFGNHVLAGFTAYDNPSNAGPVSFVQMTGGSVIYGSVTAGVFQTVATGAATVQGSTSVLGLVAPVDPLNPVTTADKAVLTLLSGATGQATGSRTTTCTWPARSTPPGPRPSPCSHSPPPTAPPSPGRASSGSRPPAPTPWTCPHACRSTPAASSTSPPRPPPPPTSTTTPTASSPSEP